MPAATVAPGSLNGCHASESLTPCQSHRAVSCRGQRPGEGEGAGPGEARTTTPAPTIVAGMRRRAQQWSLLAPTAALATGLRQLTKGMTELARGRIPLRSLPESVV
jgi:hypothetical protein